MIEGPWVDWSVKNHIDEAERLVKQGGDLRVAAIHATLALTKAQLGQVVRGY